MSSFKQLIFSIKKQTKFIYVNNSNFDKDMESNSNKRARQEFYFTVFIYLFKAHICTPSSNHTKSVEAIFIK